MAPFFADQTRLPRIAKLRIERLHRLNERKRRSEEEEEEEEEDDDDERTTKKIGIKKLEEKKLLSRLHRIKRRNKHKHIRHQVRYHAGLADGIANAF